MNPPVESRILSVAPSPAFFIAITLYLAAALAFVIGASGRTRASRVAHVLMTFAFVAHGIDIGWRGVDHVHPAESVREALGLLAWLLAGGYLAAASRYRLELAGAVVAPVAMGILLAARLTPAGNEPTELTPLGRIHIMLAIVGVSIFAIASALAAIYLLEEKSFKAKKLDSIAWKGGGAPLEALDKLANRLVVVGFPIFTLAMVLGVIWVSERHESFDRPEYPLALVTWLSFATLLATRVAYGWRGKRAARLTLVGFGAALTVLAIYLVRRIVGS
ncbi:MAG TPA: cytochrome c biogenesis protein CcsA [Kofleriaceae bacterium]|nr:cytochrome c biogenesis protein CcsA [Kofleriaceae bacterium]